MNIKQIREHLNKNSKLEGCLLSGNYDGWIKNSVDRNIKYLKSVQKYPKLTSDETKKNIEKLLKSNYLSKAQSAEKHLDMSTAGSYYELAGEQLKAAHLFFSSEHYVAMETILTELGETKLLDEANLKIARKYEAKNEFLEAGFYYRRANQDEKFADCFLSWLKNKDKRCENIPSKIEIGRREEKLDLYDSLLEVADIYKKKGDKQNSHFPLMRCFSMSYNREKCDTYSDKIKECENIFEKLKELDYWHYKNKEFVVEKMDTLYHVRLKQLLNEGELVKARVISSKMTKLEEYKR